MKKYYVVYKLYSHAKEKAICIAASSKKAAYDRAVYEAIPATEGQLPYSAWVHSVTYRNGNWKLFNNHEGKPY